MMKAIFSFSKDMYSNVNLKQDSQMATDLERVLKDHLMSHLKTLSGVPGDKKHGLHAHFESAIQNIETQAFSDWFEKFFINTPEEQVKNFSKDDFYVLTLLIWRKYVTKSERVHIYF